MQIWRLSSNVKLSKISPCNLVSVAPTSAVWELPKSHRQWVGEICSGCQVMRQRSVGEVGVVLLGTSLVDLLLTAVDRLKALQDTLKKRRRSQAP